MVGEMSNLKRDIQAELADAMAQGVILFDDNIKSKGNPKAQDPKKYIETHTQNIINLIESVLPEESPHTPIAEAHIHEMAKTCCVRVEGYNQAIKDIKSKLIGGSNGKE